VAEEKETPVLVKPYGIVSIKRSDAPAGTEGKNWYKEVVGQLNERRMGKRGRVNLVPTPKKKA